MSRITVPLEYVADFSGLRRQYDEHREYVRRNPPTVDYSGSGGTGGTARTFGGGEVPVSSQYRAAGMAADRSATALENREVREAAAAARMAAQVDRVDRQTRVIDARRSGGARGALGEIDSQIASGGSAVDIARLQQRRAMVIEQITREEMAAHQRSMAESDRAAAAQGRRAQQQDRQAETQRRRLTDARLRAALEAEDDPLVRAGVLRRFAEQEPDEARRTRMLGRATGQERRASVREYLTDRFEGAAGIAFAAASVGHMLGAAETEMRIGERRRFLTGDQALQEEEGIIAGRNPLAGAGRRALAAIGRGMGKNDFLSSRFDDAGALATVREAQQQSQASKLADNLIDQTREARQRGGAVGASGLGAEWLAVGARRENEAVEITRARSEANRLGGREGARAFAQAGALEAQQRRQAAAEQADISARMGEAIRTGQDRIDIFGAQGSGANFQAGLLALGSEARQRNDQALRDTKGMEWSQRVPYLDTVRRENDAKAQSYWDKQYRADSETLARSGFATSAETLGRQGFSGEARVAGINAQFAPIFDATGKVIGFQGLDTSTPRGQEVLQARQAAYQSALAGAAVETRREEIRTAGGLSMLRKIASGDDFGASVEEIETERRGELEGVTSQSKIDEINERANLRQQINRRDRRRMASGIAFAQDAEARAIGARAQHDEIGASAIEIAAQGAMTGAGYARQGLGDRAAKEQSNTRATLDLLRQNYLDNFQGVQVDLRNIDTQGPRDAQDPNTVLRNLDETISKLPDLFRDALKEAISS